MVDQHESTSIPQRGVPFGQTVSITIPTTYLGRKKNLNIRNFPLKKLIIERIKNII